MDFLSDDPSLKFGQRILVDFHRGCWRLLRSYWTPQRIEVRNIFNLQPAQKKTPWSNKTSNLISTLPKIFTMVHLKMAPKGSLEIPNVGLTIIFRFHLQFWEGFHFCIQLQWFRYFNVFAPRFLRCLFVLWGFLASLNLMRLELACSLELIWMKGKLLVWAKRSTLNGGF